jgi:Zn-dependent protease with chaperone function
MLRVMRMLAALGMLLLPVAQAQDDPARAFKFGTVDLKLLDEVQELDRQYNNKGLVYGDPELSAYLQQVGARLLADRPAPERVQFAFRVLRDPMVNAFAMPNGFIYVNTGLLAVLENEAQLAGVLAHEITHVEFRHTYRHNRNLRKKMVAMDVFFAVSTAGGYFPAGSVFGAALTLAGSVSQVLVSVSVYGYSQDLERDADRNAVAMMAKAGYDAHAMQRAFQLLDERLEFEPVETFYRTHPKLQERIASTKQWADAETVPEPRGGSETDYLARTAGAICYNIRVDLDSRRARTAVARANRLVRWRPDVPAYQVLLADSHRELGAKTPEPSSDESTSRGQADQRKRFLKLTAEEEQRELMAKPGGSAEKKANSARAEQLYRDAIDKNPALADAHRGLGMLYENQSRRGDAALEYKRYLELAPADAVDRLRIERRIERIEKELKTREPEK